MRLEHHLVGGYVRYISPYIIIIINLLCSVTPHWIAGLCGLLLIHCRSYQYVQKSPAGVRKQPGVVCYVYYRMI